MTQYIVRGGSGDAGWEHGLPPALTPAAWPRHRSNGLPLVHGFTIRLPEEFRAQGDDRVAISYFHPGESESYGATPALQDRISKIMTGELAPSSSDTPFWHALAEHVKTPQPNTQYLKDLLEHTHAIVWLTEAELAGPRCPRPEQELPDGVDPRTMHLQKPVPDEEKLSYSADEDERVIQLGQPLNWVQAEVDGFGECVMEIEDDVGRANYGTGNCQIDLENSLLDWAC